MTATGAVLLLLQFFQPPCAPTPTEPLLPSIVDSAIGNDPVWLVDGSSGHFPEKGFGKTLWIFKARTPVRVRGHELGSGAAARLRHQGANGPINYEMVIENARAESVLPGGAGRELLDVYAFIPSYVFYPRRGCSQFDVEVNGGTRHITLEIKSRHLTARTHAGREGFGEVTPARDPRIMQLGLKLIW
jgi:hypothetical protein